GPMAWTISKSDRDGSNSDTAQVVKGIILDRRLVRIAVVSSSENAPARLRANSYNAETRWLLSAMELSTAVTRFSRLELSRPAAGVAALRAALSTAGDFFDWGLKAAACTPSPLISSGEDLTE